MEEGGGMLVVVVVVGGLADRQMHLMHLPVFVCFVLFPFISSRCAGAG